MQNDADARRGRPLEDGVTASLLEAALLELSERGFESATISAVAARAHTSKQAVYRRFDGKTGLFVAALEDALRKATPPPPQRLSVAEDLRRCLLHLTKALQETPLGGALRALVPYRGMAKLAAVLEGAEAEQRLILRQVLIATAFETDMETRIDLLLGLIYFRLLLSSTRPTLEDVERAIYLVLGLVAPRGPVQSKEP